MNLALTRSKLWEFHWVSCNFKILTHLAHPIVVGIVRSESSKYIGKREVHRGRQGLLFCILRTYALFSELALFCTFQENAHFPHQISC